jgi:hypothetical protein
MNCESFQERIIEIAEGTPPDADDERHLASCERCRIALDWSRGLVGRMASLPASAAPSGAYEEHLRRRQRARRGFWLRFAVAAAALLVAVGAGAFLSITRHERMAIAIRDVDRGSGTLPEDAWLGPLSSQGN